MANEDIFHLGVKALIRNKKGEVLVLQANIKDFKRGTSIEEHWDLPGGRIQKGSTIEETLVREVEEEIGVTKIKIVKLLDASLSKMRISHVDAGLILFTYLCEIDEGVKIALTDNEHLNFKWCEPQEAAKLLSTKFSDSLVEVVKNLS